MNVCILTLTHLSLEEIQYHRHWHEQLGCDYKVIWQTDQKTDDENIYTIDIPGKIIIPSKMRIYCHFAKRLKEYDYFVFLDSDSFILDKNFIKNNINDMVKNDKHVCFTHLCDQPEHYKSSFNGYVQKWYRTEDLKWSMNICTFVNDWASYYYDENNFEKIYDEVDFACFTMAKFKWMLSKYVDINFFGAGVAAEWRLSKVKDGKYPAIAHAVKDYKMLEKEGIKIK